MLNAISPKVFQKVRERAGFTQAELGVAIGGTRFTISNFEKGKGQPDRAQEERLLEVTGCSREEYVELVCEELSEWIGKPVGIREPAGAYEPSSALSRAYELVRKHATELPAAMTRALNSKISTTRLLRLAFERHIADLLDFIQDCRELLGKRVQEKDRMAEPIER